MHSILHGGDTYGLKAVVDLSSNVHPLGMPPTMITVLQQAIPSLRAYPDPQCRDLRQAIAQRDGVEANHILCGNGAADLIFRLVQALKPKRALLTAPTFGEYGQALETVGCQIQRHLLLPEQSFALDESFLQALEPGLDMAFVCTPNNPTGQVVAPVLLEKIAQRCQQIQCYLVVDECFLDLCHSPHPYTYLLGNPYVVLLRAFTKSYAMAGLRLGYCVSQNPDVLAKLTAFAQPWSVSTLAQLAGIEACACPEWTQTGRLRIDQERPRMMAFLQSKGCQVFLGQANYLLFYKANYLDLQEKLLAHGVLIRSCANYPGLGAGYYRIAISTPEHNTALIKAWEEAYG